MTGYRKSQKIVDSVLVTFRDCYCAQVPFNNRVKSVYIYQTRDLKGLYTQPNIYIIFSRHGNYCQRNKPAVKSFEQGSGTTKKETEKNIVINRVL